MIKLCARNGVRPDRKYLNTISREKLLLEVKSARGHMKKKCRKKQSEKNSVVSTNLDNTRIPNHNLAHTEKPTKTTMNNTVSKNAISSNKPSPNTATEKTNVTQTHVITNNEQASNAKILNKSAIQSETQNNPGATKKELAENLNGANVSNFDSYKPKKPCDLRIPPKPLGDVDDDPGHQTTMVERTIQTVHAKLQTGSNQINPPHEIRKLIIQMRKGDPMIQIVPVNDESSTSSDKIGNEKELPDDEVKLAKWVDNIHTIETKIHFTMKIKTMNIDDVKTAVFNWCKGNGRFVKFTSLQSTKNFTEGWFHGIHPFYYNRDDFCEYVFEHLPDLKTNIDIYQKKVWKWNEKRRK